ncbi:ABC transporter substrate-binding protein [Streptomyces formicae]|uniref:Extracellular solute-binding protein n=1 Tax=Streptomyces formicae TaxID=1616117 RepID=A0ABY3WMV6_9ACTN|nr:extracellular solute-binding protein [Streptomyces formicae]UNM12789.1 extracellular solute-binding protein [Streptomyces formicae]
MRGPLRALAAATAVLALGLTAACGDSGGVGGAQDAAQETAGPGQTVTLDYWTWFPPEATLKETIGAFEKKNPHIDVRLREFEAADYQKQLPLALNGGESLDIVGVQVAAMTNTVREQLRPVDSWQDELPAGWRDKLNGQMLDQTAGVAEDDTLYSVPMGSIGSAVMYSNAALLAELGIPFPTTAAELKTAVGKVKKAKPGVTPVVFQGDPFWQEEMLFTIAGQTDPKLSDRIAAGRAKWNDPAVVEALKSYKSLFDDGVLDTSVLSLKGSRPAELFNSGKAAFLVDGSWQSSLLSASYRKDNEIGLTDVGAGAFPVVRDGGRPAARGLAEGGLAIPKSSKHVAEAAAFIEYMTLGDGVSQWSKDLVLVPALDGFRVDSSVLTSDAAREGYQAVQDVIAADGSARDSNQAFLNQVEGNTILDVLRGQTTPEKAADKLQQEWASGRYTQK